MTEILLENWAVVALGLLAFVDIIVSLTPSTKDDEWAGYIRIILNAISGKKRKSK